MKRAFNVMITLLVLPVVMIYIYGIAKYWIHYGHPPVDLPQPLDHPNFFSCVFMLLVSYFTSHYIHFYTVLEDLLALWSDRQEKKHRTLNWPHDSLGAAFVYKKMGIWVAFAGAFIILLTLLAGCLLGFKLVLPLKPLAVYGLLTGYGSSLLLMIFEKIFRIDTLGPPDKVQIGFLSIMYSFYPMLAAVFLIVINIWTVSAFH